MTENVNQFEGLEALRFEQARELKKNTRSSCIVVSMVILYIAILFVANAHFILGLSWLATTLTMIAVTFLYSRVRAPEGITEQNYQPYLDGHTVVSGVTGLVWSGFAIYQLESSSIFSMFIAASIVCSITLGGMFPTSVYRPTYIAILTGSLVPLIIYWSVVMPTPERFFSIGLAIYYFFGIAMSAKTEISSRDLILARQSKELNDNLLKQHEIDKVANEEKSRFMAATAHDFSQPLHAQGYFIQALKDSLTEQSHLELLDKIEMSWRNQGNLLQGIADISRLDSGITTAQKKSVNLESLLQKISDEFQVTAEDTQITLHSSLMPLEVFTDPILLSRIVQNLMSNAFKFSDEDGHITLRIEEQEGNAVITVKDNGLGIAPIDQDKVFNEYIQLNNVEKDRQKGLGLGLSIVQRLVNLLSVRLDLVSAPGVGSTFTLTLPLIGRAVTANETPQKKSLNTEGNVILIVDDEKEIRESMSLLLRSWGNTVFCAADGSEALTLLTELATTPDLFIVDNRLSESERGVDLIPLLRDEINEAVPAVLITGDVSGLAHLSEESDIKLLTKPVEPAMIKRIVDKLGEPSLTTSDEAEKVL